MPKGKSKPKAKAKKHARHSARSMRINTDADADDRGSARERTSRTKTGHATSPSSPPKDAKDANQNNHSTTADNILGTDTADAAQTPDRQALLSPKPTPPGGTASATARASPGSVDLESRGAHTAPCEPSLSPSDGGGKPIKLESSARATSPTILTPPVGGTPATSPTIVTTPVDDSPSVAAQDPPDSINLTELHVQGLDDLQRIQSDYDRALDCRKRARDALKRAMNKADRDVDLREILEDSECFMRDVMRSADNGSSITKNLKRTAESVRPIGDRHVSIIESYKRAVDDWELAKAQHERLQNDQGTTENGKPHFSDSPKIVQSRAGLAKKRQFVNAREADMRELGIVVSVFQTGLDVGRSAFDIHEEARRIFVDTASLLDALKALAEAKLRCHAYHSSSLG